MSLGEANRCINDSQAFGTKSYIAKGIREEEPAPPALLTQNNKVQEIATITRTRRRVTTPLEKQLGFTRSISWQTHLEVGVDAPDVSKSLIMYPLVDFICLERTVRRHAVN